MTFLLGMPGGSEWIFILVILIPLFALPALTIILYIRNKELKRQLNTMNDKMMALIEKLPGTDKTGNA